MRYIIPFAALLYMGCSEKSTDTAESQEESDTSAPSEELPQDSVCAELSTSECATREDCFVISGVPLEYVEAEDCFVWGASQEVGCMSADLDCGAMESWASDGEGECMFFSNTCYPENWDVCDTLTEYTMCP